MLRITCLLALGCGAASVQPTSAELAPVEIPATAEEAPEVHLGATKWELENEDCHDIILPMQALPRDPAPCMNVDLHAGVSEALLRQVDLMGAQVPVLLSIEPGVVFPDVTMHHVLALRLGGGHYDAAPLPPRALFPAVRYLATYRSVVLPDNGWFEADEVQLGLTLVDEDSLSAIQAVAERVIALQIETRVADQQEELARLTHLRDVSIGNSAADIAVLPTTVTHLDIGRADDSLVALLPRLTQLRSLSLNGSRLETLQPLAGLDLTHLSLREAHLGEDALAALPSFPNLAFLDLYTMDGDGHTVLGLATMTSLEVLNLWGRRVDAASLTGLTNLRVLTLNGSAVTDEHIVALSALSSLHTLSLRATGITEAALRSLPPVVNLDLGHTGVTNLCEQVARLRSLRSLDLSFTAITDAGISCIVELAELETLNLGATNISDASMDEVARLPELRDLSLMTTSLTDAGLASLARLQDLRILDVAGAPLSDASVEPLLAMDLQHVEGLSGTVSESAQERVRRALTSAVQTE